MAGKMTEKDKNAKRNMAKKNQAVMKRILRFIKPYSPFLIISFV